MAACCFFAALECSARSTFLRDPEYLIDTWETEDGLPENSATAMVQTPDGYLWFGTFNGLVRFDGNKFTVLDPVNTPEFHSAGVVNRQTAWFRIVVALLLVGIGAAATTWVSRMRRGYQSAVRERTEAQSTAREVSGKLITAQEEERRRLARDLHDDLNQSLALVSVELELMGRNGAGDGSHGDSAARIERMANRIRNLSTEVHRISYELHPAKLDQLGLVSAARSFCRERSRHCGVPIGFTALNVPRDLRPDVALCVYRIIQECVQNMVKHSRATSAQVQLSVEGEILTGTISDNGKGFDMGRPPHLTGLGLVSIQERIRLARGKVQVESKPGLGTRAEFSLPLTAGQRLSSE